LAAHFSPYAVEVTFEWLRCNADRLCSKPDDERDRISESFDVGKPTPKLRTEVERRVLKLSAESKTACGASAGLVRVLIAKPGLQQKKNRKAAQSQVYSSAPHISLLV